MCVILLYTLCLYALYDCVAHPVGDDGVLEDGDLPLVPQVLRHQPAQHKKGKGRRFCLAGRLYSIPCCASYFAYRTVLKNRMNSSFSLNLSWCNSSYNSNRLVQNIFSCKEFKISPPPPQRSNDIFLFFCLYPSSMRQC